MPGLPSHPTRERSALLHPSRNPEPGVGKAHCTQAWRSAFSLRSYTFVRMQSRTWAHGGVFCTHTHRNEGQQRGPFCLSSPRGAESRWKDSSSAADWSGMRAFSCGPFTEDGDLCLASVFEGTEMAFAGG